VKDRARDVEEERSGAHTPLLESHVAGVVGIRLLECGIEQLHALLIHRAQVALGILLTKRKNFNLLVKNMAF
jgi:hypothetical protein